ncbi:MAG: hypothetical protein L6Q37_14225, partial [Bdellovibrionaceae bacterium]|nr:hypothetical protein [Pseudobdellovibrionaceae bacterium]
INNGFCWISSLGQLKCKNPNLPPFLVDSSDGLLDVTDFTSVKQFALSPTSTTICAVHNNGSVRCAGDNSNYQLGNGLANAPTTSVLLAEFDNPGVEPVIKKVVIGGNFTCALAISGSVYCWGKNNVGQLGQNPGVLSFSLSPVLLAGFPNFTDIVAGQTHMCGYSSTQGLYCWGNIPGANSFTFIPINVSTNTSILQLAGNASGSCYIENSTGSKKLYCFGYNFDGELFSNHIGRILLPEAMTVLTNEPLMVSMNNNSNSSCVVLVDGRAQCVGGQGVSMGKNLKNFTENRPVNSRFSLGFQDIIMSRGTHCLKAADSKYYCHGTNLFDTTKYNFYNVEPEIIGNGDVLSFDQGEKDFQCYIDSDKKVYCRGDNTYGQLGDGTTTASSTFKYVSVLGTNNIQLALGSAHACALKENNEVWCWGYNFNSQLGINLATSSPWILATPTQVTGLTSSPIQKIVAGLITTCILTSDSKVYCWGSNLYGHFANGVFTGSSLAPVEVSVPGGVLKLYVNNGSNFSCALNLQKKLYCWGVNQGALGDGTSVNRGSPTLINFPSEVQIEELAITDYASCARTSSGQLYCWGINSLGSLGDGTTVNHFSPQIVSNIQKGATKLSGHYYGKSGIGYTANFCAIVSTQTNKSDNFCWGTGATRVPGYKHYQPVNFLIN